MPRLPNSKRGFFKQYQHQLHFELDYWVDIWCRVSNLSWQCVRSWVLHEIKKAGRSLLYYYNLVLKRAY